MENETLKEWLLKDQEDKFEEMKEQLRCQQNWLDRSLPVFIGDSFYDLDKINNQNEIKKVGIVLMKRRYQCYIEARIKNGKVHGKNIKCILPKGYRGLFTFKYSQL